MASKRVWRIEANGWVVWVVRCIICMFRSATKQYQQRKYYTEHNLTKASPQKDRDSAERIISIIDKVVEKDVYCLFCIDQKTHNK